MGYENLSQYLADAEQNNVVVITQRFSSGDCLFKLSPKYVEPRETPNREVEPPENRLQIRYDSPGTGDNELCEVVLSWSAGSKLSEGVSVSVRGAWDWEENIVLENSADNQGLYSTVVYLPRGTYHYKYVLVGSEGSPFWFADLTKPTVDVDEGGVNNLLQV